MRWVLLLGYLLLMLFTASVCQHWLNQQLLEKASQQSSNLAAFLRYSIGRYATLPAQLANSPQLQQDSNTLNPWLQQLQQSAQVADLYLMDAAGIVRAASNWQSSQSYVGRDFAFRPYFQAAQAGKAGFYYALGHTSGMRGVYYSAPVATSSGRCWLPQARCNKHPAYRWYGPAHNKNRPCQPALPENTAGMQNHGRHRIGCFASCWRRARCQRRPSDINRPPARFVVVVATRG